MVVASAFAAVSAESKEVAMRSPSPIVDQHEKMLDSKQIASLSCTDHIRRSFSDEPGIVMDSERVSHSDKFGYIYRYDVARLLEDDSGGYTARRVLVVWTADCETYEIASYPTYQLPPHVSK
jgi:hypothetical protein